MLYFFWDFISTVVAFIIDIMRDRVSEGYILDLLNGLFKYNSPVVLLQAICLLYVFKSFNFNDFWKKPTLGIAPLSFGVYIIHGHKILFWALIVEKWNWLTGCSVYKQLFVSLGVSLLIFGVCLAIDWVRYRIFEVLRVRELLRRFDGSIATDE